MGSKEKRVSIEDLPKLLESVTCPTCGKAWLCSLREGASKVQKCISCCEKGTVLLEE